MRFPKKTAVALTLCAVGAAVYPQVRAYWHERSRPRFREELVSRGRVVFHVNSTGTVQPVVSVHIGSFVSGPIEQLFVDFNQPIKKGQLLAKIDPRIYESNVQRDQAILASRRADVERVQALLDQALNDERRALSLRHSNRDYVSETEMDQYHFNCKSLTAQLALAQAAVKEARASLANSEANLGYTEIRSPVDGVVIDRKIDPGQTLAAQFQTPELFVVAPDLRKEMYVQASVDEADMGLIRKAQERRQPVQFTVDAYPDDLFSGTIYQVRMSSTTNQNVVTYPVVVSAPNPDLKLLPGMTANLSFQIEEKADALRVPNAALRFFPRPEHVWPEDRPVLEGSAPRSDKDQGNMETVLPAGEKVAASRKRHRRHVWVLDGELLRAVPLDTGVSDGQFTAVEAGDLAAGQKVVTGLDTGKP